MQKRKRICLYGNSVIVGTLGASLRRFPRYEVNTLSPPWPETVELETMEPDVIVFDVEADRPEAAFFLLEKHPTLMVIGVSPDNNLVRIWSGQQLCELSTQALVEVIDEQLGGPVPFDPNRPEINPPDLDKNSNQQKGER